MRDNSIDEVVDWSLKRLVELMDSDDVSVDEYNSFVNTRATILVCSSV